MGIELKIQELEVGSNYITATLGCGYGSVVEVEFTEIPKRIVQDTFKLYGIELGKEIEDYHY